MTYPKQMLIDGEWRSATGGAQLEVLDPATETTIGTVPDAAATDVADAVAAAERAWRDWRDVDAWTRSAMLRVIAGAVRDSAEEIAEITTAESGKPRAEAVGEVGAAADQFDWYADEARRIYGRTIDGHSRDHRLMVIRQPIGVVAAFTAWNFPALLPARKIAPAVAAGCSVIVKPAEETPFTTLKLAEVCQQAGLPPGVLNVVTGEPNRISDQLLDSPQVRKVSLTGSVPVGQKVLRRAAAGVLSVSMELGGHAPVLVFADADPVLAGTVAAQAKFRNCGQVCISPSRFYVHESVADEFTQTFVRATAALCIGDGRDPDTDVGPLASERRRETVERLVGEATGAGASVAQGGRRPPGLDRGFFYEPTVLTEVHDSMSVMTEEPFGPIAPIATFDDADDVLRRANDVPYGLAGYIFTSSLRTAFEAAEALEVGMVGVNNLVIATAEAPFGGIKQSGFGREGGAEGIDSYTVTKYINMRL